MKQKYYEINNSSMIEMWIINFSFYCPSYNNNKTREKKRWQAALIEFSMTSYSRLEEWENIKGLHYSFGLYCSWLQGPLAISIHFFIIKKTISALPLYKIAKNMFAAYLNNRETPMSHRQFHHYLVILEILGVMEVCTSKRFNHLSI